MSSTSFFTSSRRMLFHTPLYSQPTNFAIANQDSPDSGEPGSRFDANVVMILAVLLCALICALGLNSIVRCALRCSNGGMALEPQSGPMARLEQTAGVRKKALKALPTQTYSPGLVFPGAGSECAICLTDFTPGERVRVLPKCNHGFHVRCVDRWLVARPSCPTCRQCLFHTCQKVSSCAEASMPVSTSPPPSSIIAPLEPERLDNEQYMRRL